MEFHTTRWYTYPVKRIFRTRTFTRWMRKAGLSDPALLVAVAEMMQGLTDALSAGEITEVHDGYKKT